MLSVFPKTLRRAAMTKLLFISYLSTYIYFHRYCTSDSHLIASLSRDRHMRRVTVTSSRDHRRAPQGLGREKGKVLKSVNFGPLAIARSLRNLFASDYTNQ